MVATGGRFEPEAAGSRGEAMECLLWVQGSLRAWKRTDEIAADIDALGLGFPHRPDVLVKEFDSPGVVNLAVFGHGVVEVGAVFCNVNRRAGISVVEPKQHVAKLVRLISQSKLVRGVSGG